jgi:signal transduction histidine kinase
MFDKEELALIERLCYENGDMNHIISKFKQENTRNLSEFTHEINNFFTLIYSTAQLIETRNPDIKKMNHWNQLYKDIKDLSELLQQLSTYNHSEKLNNSKVNLITLLKDIQNSFNFIALQKGITLSIENAESNSIYVSNYFCDYVKLRQVFYNVFKNAVEATKKGDYITIQLPKNNEDIFIDENNEAFIIISIANNGDPIPAESLEKIFTPFVTNKSNGTGLGLAIVSKILNAHGGKITVESTKQLTTFSIYLPISKNH